MNSLKNYLMKLLPSFIKTIAVRIQKSSLYSSLAVSMTYMLIGAFWIAFSDNFLDLITNNAEQYRQLQTYKGWAFILVTGTVLFLLLLQELKRREKIENELRNNLKEKQLLMNEVHHRVKNNLNSIVSLLSIQRTESDSKQLGVELNTALSRILSISTIHELLYKSNDLQHINLKDYVPKLIQSYHKINDHNLKSFTFESEIDDVIINIDKAITCGIILNELITNSLKHALEENRQCKIKIDIKNLNGHCIMEVSNNGKSVPENWSINNSIKNKKGLGIVMVTFLVKQLKGDINVTKDSGLKYNISFPLDTYA